MDLARVAVVYRAGGAATLQEIYRASVGVCEPIILLAAAEAAAHPEILAAARRVMVTRVLEQGTDTAGAIRICRDLQVRGVVAFHDLDLELCDAVTVALDLPGVSTTEAPWDKLHQRERIPLDISVPAVSVNSASELWPAVEKIGFPALLKPTRATGGSGVAFIRDSDDVRYQQESRRQWEGLLLESCITMVPHPSAAEHLAGFVSVESVSTGDTRHHVAMFDKIPVVVGRRKGTEGSDSVLVAGDVFPSRLDLADRKAVVDAVDRSLAALGVRWRVTHTEVALTANGPVIIEVNGRVGGNLNRLLLLAGGIDLVRSAFECALGLTPRLGDPNPSVWTLGYNPPFAEPAGVVRSQVSMRDVRGLPGVRGVYVLAQQGAPRTESDGRMLKLTACAEDLATLDAYYAEISRGVRALFSQDDETV